MAATTNDEVISVLNNLIETCRDGQNGFTSAAEGVTNPKLQQLFMQYAQQRSAFVGELQRAVRELGGDPETTGSVAAALHRGWIDIKAAVAGRNEHSVLEECERGEDSAKENYQDAMQEVRAGDVSNLIRTQYEAIKQAHDHIRTLRDRTESVSA